LSLRREAFLHARCSKGCLNVTGHICLRFELSAFFTRQLIQTALAGRLRPRLLERGRPQSSQMWVQCLPRQLREVQRASMNAH
jgi:hypothetical protein